LGLEGAGNAGLRRVDDLISVDVRRLAHRSIRGAGRQRTAFKQHRAILEAKNGDADPAESLITQHMRRGRDNVITQFDGAAG